MSYLPSPSVVREVQRALGVAVDGNAGVQTWNAIYRSVCGDEPLTNLPDCIRSVQGRLGINGKARDGIAGPDTWGAIRAKICGSAGATPHSEGAGGTPALPVDGGQVDARSEASIATLHPLLGNVARALIRAAAERGITIRIISGTRSDAEQNALYAQGRSAPGKIVTKARAGYSNHNFGLAFDIGVFVAGTYLSDSPAYAICGGIGKSLGLAWGGDWASIQDEPHFELRPAWAAHLSEGQMLVELRRRKEIGKDAFTA